MATPPGSLSAVPEFPPLSDRLTYNIKAYTFCTAMRITFAPEMLALANNVYSNAIETAVNAALAASSATSAAISAGATTWVSGANGLAGELKSSPLTGRVFRRINPGAWTTDPSADPVNWALVSLDPQWVKKSANYTALSGDAIQVDTSAGVVTILLPPNPLPNDVCRTSDYAGTFDANNLVVSGNGKPIMFQTGSVAVSRRNRKNIWTFIDNTKGWEIS